MWFDAQAALAAIQRGDDMPNPAIRAIPANPASNSRLAEVAGGPGSGDSPTSPHSHLALAVDHFHERAAIREYESGQPRRDAERDALNEAALAWGVDAAKIVGSISDGNRYREEIRARARG